MSATMAAQSGGKPRLISSGAASAAGVPKPAAPSMKAANTKPTMIAWMRRSGFTLLNTRWMAVTAPECLSVFMIRMAPRMMTRVPMASRKPSSAHAAEVVKSCFQYSRAITTATSQPSGRARFAGQLKASIRTMTSKMGSEAISAVIVSPPKY